MTHTFDGFNWFIRLEKEERLTDSLQKFFEETQIEGAWVSGIGAVIQAELGIFNLQTKQYQWQTFDQELEVDSLQGNIALGEDGKQIFHLHGVFSSKDFKAIGGHVKDLVVGGTLELFVHKSYKPIHRKQNDDTGLKLLDL